MQNAHCRLGRLEYLRSSEKTNTQVFLHVDHYVGDGEQAHLLSLFGGDAEVGAIRAAIYEKHVFTLTFPDGGSQKIGFGPDAECYYGSLSLPGAKRSLRHLVAVSAALHANGTAGQTFLMHLDAETKDLAWATVVSLLGLPADPRWGEVILSEAKKEKRMHRIDGIGCCPAVILGTREDFMSRIGQARSLDRLPFPDWNGPILWPQYSLRSLISRMCRPHPQDEEIAA
jgi:hypothetical protein